jgi:hyperosmotically inducible periplasmic protein
MTTRVWTLILVAGLVAGGTVACKSSGGMRSSTQTASLDDATIATRVKTALLNEPELKALEIQVQSENGVVTLVGAVPSEPQVSRAVAVARTVGGVRDVRSSLKVGS